MKNLKLLAALLALTIGLAGCGKGSGQWFLWEQYLMTGIRVPTSADPWA